MKKKVVYSNLAAEMARKRITQKDLAKILGVNNVGIHSRLYGEVEWKLSEICKVMNLFNLGFEYLFEKGE